MPALRLKHDTNKHVLNRHLSIRVRKDILSLNKNLENQDQ